MTTATPTEQPLKVVPPSTDDAAQLAPPAAADPDPATLDPDTEVVDPEVEDAPSVPAVQTETAAVAIQDRFDGKLVDANWPYEWVDFKGDTLAVRVPTRVALAGFSLASTKHVAGGMQNDLSSFFIVKHLSSASYARVISRMIDPDEKNFTIETVGDLFNAIVAMALTDEEKADMEANAEA